MRRILILSMPILLWACFFVFGFQVQAASVIDIIHECDRLAGGFGRNHIFVPFNDQMSDKISGISIQFRSEPINTTVYLCQGIFNASNPFNNYHACF